VTEKLINIDYIYTKVNDNISESVANLSMSSICNIEEISNINTARSEALPSRHIANGIFITRTT